MKKIFIQLSVLVILLFAETINCQTPDTIFNKFTPKFYIINGYKINVETLGKGEPIVFISGGPGNSLDYMLGNFGKYYKTNKVIFIDFLGRGLSDNAKDKSEYSVDNDVEILEGVRKALNLAKISIVGHSYGTVHAQAYVLKYPQYVDKLVLISGFHSAEMWQANCDSYNHYTKTHFPEQWKKVDSLRALGYVSSDSVFSKLYNNIPSKYVYYHNTQLNQILPKYNFRGMNLDVYYSIIGRDADFYVGGDMINQDYRRDLHKINSPTLIIAGRYDGVSTPEYALQYKNFMPQAKFVMFENSGHNPYLEEPEKFFKLFDDFFGVSLSN
jgi:proline iminopeptidase